MWCGVEIAFYCGVTSEISRNSLYLCKLQNLCATWQDREGARRIPGSRAGERTAVSEVCILAGDRREPRETIDVIAGIKQHHEIILLKLNHVENI